MVKGELWWFLLGLICLCVYVCVFVCVTHLDNYFGSWYSIEAGFGSRETSKNGILGGKRSLWKFIYSNFSFSPLTISDRLCESLTTACKAFLLPLSYPHARAQINQNQRSHPHSWRRCAPFAFRHAKKNPISMAAKVKPEFKRVLWAEVVTSGTSPAHSGYQTWLGSLSLLNLKYLFGQSPPPHTHEWKWTYYTYSNYWKWVAVLCTCTTVIFSKCTFAYIYIVGSTCTSVHFK